MSNEQKQSDKVMPQRAWRIGGPMTPPQRSSAKALFLAVFAKEANVTLAAEKAGIAPKTAYEWRKKDAKFADAWEEAVKASNDVLRGEMWRRAVHGVESYVVSMGRMVYEEIPDLDEDGSVKRDKRNQPMYKRGDPIIERKYSDTLLMALAKARMPEFREKSQVEIDAQVHDHGTKALYDAIAAALADFPEAKIRVAQALANKESQQ